MDLAKSGMWLIFEFARKLLEDDIKTIYIFNIGSCMFKMQLKERSQDSRGSTHEVTQVSKGNYFSVCNGLT